MEIPACWTWPVTEVEHEKTFRALLASDENAALRLLETWQARRCAICGRRDALDADHDHDTGYLRGMTCHSCNVREGHASDGQVVFSRYRRRPPVAILGIRIYWRAPDSARAITAALGPDPIEALTRWVAARDPAR